MSNPDKAPERDQCAALGAEIIIPLFGCALAAYYFISTTELVWEAKATGIVIGTVLGALCIAQFVRFGMQYAAGRGYFGLGELVANNFFNRQRLLIMVQILLFVVTLPWVGTAPGLFLVLIGCMWTLGVRSYRQLFTIAFTTAAIVHLLLITLLGSRLPQGVIIDLIKGSGG